MDRKFLIALGAYAGLALVAFWLLDGELLWLTWLVLAVLAVKSWLVVLKRRLDS